MEKLAVDIVVGIYSGLVTTLVQDKSEKLAGKSTESLAQYEAARPVAQKLSDKITASCRKLPKEECDIIARYLSNEVTVASLVELVKAGTFDAALIQSIFETNPISESILPTMLTRICVQVQDVFDECIAEEDFASHYLVSRQLRSMRADVQKGAAASERVESSLAENLVPKLDALTKKVDAALAQQMLQSVGQASAAPQIDAFVHTNTRQISIVEVLNERLESQFNKRVEAANRALSDGKTQSARQLFLELYKELENQTDAASQKAYFRAVNGIALSYWYAHENPQAKEWFQKTTELTGDEKLNTAQPYFDSGS